MVFLMPFIADAVTTSAESYSRRGILRRPKRNTDTSSCVGISNVGRGILDAVLVRHWEFVSRRISPDVLSDVVKDVGNKDTNVVLASSDVMLHRESPPLL